MCSFFSGEDWRRSCIEYELFDILYINMTTKNNKQLTLFNKENIVARSNLSNKLFLKVTEANVILFPDLQSSQGYLVK